jgi:hypothetical protein
MAFAEYNASEKLFDVAASKDCMDSFNEYDDAKLKIAFAEYRAEEWVFDCEDDPEAVDGPEGLVDLGYVSESLPEGVVGPGKY